MSSNFTPSHTHLDKSGGRGKYNFGSNHDNWLQKGLAFKEQRKDRFGFPIWVLKCGLNGHGPCRSLVMHLMTTLSSH